MHDELASLHLRSYLSVASSRAVVLIIWVFVPAAATSLLGGRVLEHRMI